LFIKIDLKHIYCSYAHAQKLQSYICYYFWGQHYC